MTMWLYEERPSDSPYGAPDQRTMLNGVVRAVQIARSMSTGLSRSSGPARKISSATCTDPIGATGCPPVWTKKGMPVTWNNRFAGSSVMARWLPPALNDGLDPDTRKLCCVLSRPPVGAGRMENAENV